MRYNYTLYGSMLNRGGRIIWLLEELELDYELINLELFKGEQRTPKFLSLNPHGKVPALVIRKGDRIDHLDIEPLEQEVIVESLAILYSLAERHQALLPSDYVERAQCHQLMAYCATELEPPLWTQAKHSFVYPKKRRIAEIIPSCLYEYQKALNYLESIFIDGRDYLLPSGFSLADIYVGQTMMWGHSRKLGELGEYSSAYIKRLRNRPAWQRAISTLPDQQQSRT